MCGYATTTAIKTDGTLWTWGGGITYNKGQLGNNTTASYSSPIQVGALTNWRSLDSDSNMSRYWLATKTDNTLWGCGDNVYGQLGNGTVTLYSSPIQVGTLTNWNQVTCGYVSSAAIKTDGTLWTWGSNSYGQLGTNSAVISVSSPVQVGALTNWKQVYTLPAINPGHTMAAIKTDGTLWMWGGNVNGQLGNGTVIAYSSPIQIGSLTNWKKVVGAVGRTAAIKTDGTLWAWGIVRNYNGTGSTINYSSPIQIGSLAIWNNISPLSYFSFLLLDNSGYLWGYGNGAGTLTTSLSGGSTSDIAQFQFQPLQKYKSISAGGQSTSEIYFAIPDYYSQDLGERYVSKDYYLDVYANIASATGNRTAPGVWAWGNNQYGSIGNNTTTYYSSPIQIGTLTNWKQVVAGGYFGAAIKTDGTLWTWGYNGYGQLGNGAATTVNYSSPVQVGALTDWKMIATNNYFASAIKTNGTLWAWGQNNAGMLGLNVTTQYSSPVQVGALTNWKQVSCATNWSSAIKTDGTLWTWGYGAGGRLGNSLITNYSSPIVIGALTNWKQVACGYDAGYAIKTDGTLWAWGTNTSGQLGNGTVTYYSSPIQIGALTNWKQVATGGTYVVSAIKTDGTLWAWGQNVYGQLGNGTVTYYSSPIQIGALTNWKSVSAGYYSTAAVKTDGTLWAWGYNTTGSLGNGTVTYYSSPIQIGVLSNWKSVANGISSFAISDGYF
jgi:alpha-tubulin suppressor-like RCC1 family protein